MKLILLTMVAILGVFVFAATLTAFGIQVPYVTETIAGLTGNATLGTARNLYSDGPVRRRNGYGPPQTYPEARGVE